MYNDFGTDLTVEYLTRLLSFVLHDGAEQTAARLVEKYGRLDLLASARREDLIEIEGMTESAVNLLTVNVALTSRRITDGFEFGIKHTDGEIADYFIGLYYGAAVETVYMLILDKRGRVMSLEYMGEGTVGASDVYPRKLLETAVRNRAAAVIIAHNHPRGRGIPSDDDKYTTERLMRLFGNAGIELLAHYVVSEREVSKVELGENAI